MSSLAIYAIISVVSGLASYFLTRKQQDHEFGQQKELLEDEQQFTSEREDLAYQRQKPDVYYNDLLDTGFNPNLAAQAVLGGNGETATASGSPSAPTTNSAINALQSMFGQSQGELYDAMRNAAEIENINANTNKTEIEAGIMPRDFALRQLTVTEQIKVWDKSVEKMSVEIGFTEEQTELAKQQNMYYGRLSEAEIKLRQEQANEAISKAKLALEQLETEKHKQKNLDSDTALKHAETDKIYDAEIPNIQANTSLLNAETSTEWKRSERERIAYEFERDLGGVPLTADGQKYVMMLANEGKYDEIKRFYDGLFLASLNQSLGEGQGKYWTNPDFKLGVGNTYLQGNMPLTRMNRHGYMSLPYWNPNQ